LRKPPPPADFDRFVTGSEPRSAPVEPPAARLVDAPLLSTRVGERREVTIYLPQDLARKLSVRCVEMDRDVSNVIAEALAQTLVDPQPEEAAEPASAPVDRWQKTKQTVSRWAAAVPATWRLRFARAS